MSADEKNALSDPEKLPDSKLRAIISEVGIKLPSGYQTRAYLVSVFNANKEIILAHFSHKQNHRRKSDTSIVIPDGVPVDPYVEPGPDLMATPQRQTRLTATKRPAPVSTQEPKVEKKKAKKANPFQSVNHKQTQQMHIKCVRWCVCVCFVLKKIRNLRSPKQIKQSLRSTHCSNNSKCRCKWMLPPQLSSETVVTLLGMDLLFLSHLSQDTTQ